MQKKITMQFYFVCNFCLISNDLEKIVYKNRIIEAAGICEQVSIYSGIARLDQ